MNCDDADGWRHVAHASIIGMMEMREVGEENCKMKETSKECPMHSPRNKNSIANIPTCAKEESNTSNSEESNDNSKK